MRLAQGQCPGFQASTIPGENRAAKLSLPGPGAGACRWTPSVQAWNKHPPRTDWNLPPRMLEDHPCSNSGRGHNPGTTLSSSNVQPRRFSRGAGQRRGDTSCAADLPACVHSAGNTATQKLQDSPRQLKAQPVVRNGAWEWELLPTALTSLWL